jgi:hypothetical protein
MVVSTLQSAGSTVQINFHRRDNAGVGDTIGPAGRNSHQRPTMKILIGGTLSVARSPPIDR